MGTDLRPDFVQYPVDEAYKLGINTMGRGQQVSPTDWLDAVARLLTSAAIMRGGVGEPTGWVNLPERTLKPQSPHVQGTVDNIKLAMSRLLKGNMSPGEADPEIARQFSHYGQRAGIAPGFFDRLYALSRRENARLHQRRERYQNVVPYSGVAGSIDDYRPLGTMSIGGTHHFPAISLKSVQYAPSGWSRERLGEYLQRLNQEGRWP